MILQSTSSSTGILVSKNLAVGHNHACTHPISFTIDKPGIYSLLGPNGSGKSTVLKTFVGLLPPILGQFTIAPNRSCAYVPQVYAVNQYFHLSVYHFIIQGYGPNFTETKGTQEQIYHYAKVWQLSNYLTKCFHELSGGQKTRTMIIRALISNPDVIFLDEPLASLDPCCQDQLMKTLFELTKTSQACIMLADHHLERFKHLITGNLIFEKHHDDPLTYVHMSVGL